MLLELPQRDISAAEQLAADAGVQVEDLVGGLIRWTAVLHARTDALEDEERDPHPGELRTDEAPSLPAACENIRRECSLGITARDVGTCPSGRLWVWELSDPNGDPLSVAVESNPRDLEQRLLDVLTGYRLGMRAIPF